MLLIGDEMAKTARKMSYEEFARRLPEVLDELTSGDEAVLVERNGQTFIVSPAPKAPIGLPPLPPLEVRLEALRKSAGGFHTPDRERFLEELRIMRQQDSKGRPG